MAEVGNVVVAHDWQALDGEHFNAGDEFFLTRQWLEHLSREGFADAHTPNLLLARTQAGSASLVLALMRLGGELRSLSNFYSSLYGPLGDTANAQHWTAIAAWLRQDARADIIDLSPLDGSAPWLASLTAAMRAEGFWVDRYFCFGNWYLPVQPGGFAAYFAALPSALRGNIERGRRRLARTGEHAFNVYIAPGETLEVGIEAFDSVYAQSWKLPEPAPRFMPSLIRLAASQGWLRLGVLHLDGVPVAAQVWLVHGGKANIYKLAYVQGYERFSPGSVLTAALMQHVMDVDQVREVDYLTGDDAYKRDWMSHRRERIGLVAFDPRRPKGLLAAARHFGGKAWRRLRRPAAGPG